MKSTQILSIKKILLYFYFITINGYSQAFITEWSVQNNLHNSTQIGTITIPTNPNSGLYNYNITWENITTPGIGNGSYSVATGNYTINGLIGTGTFPNTYRVTITGNFPHFFMNNNINEQEKLISIKQWGNIEWKSMENAFQGCSKLLFNAIDTPNLSQVTNMKNMFHGCILFDDNGTMNNWNTSNIINMERLFYGIPSLDVNINNWNTSNVTTMKEMFNSCYFFNSPLGNWNVSNVTDMSKMLNSCIVFKQNLGSWTFNSNVNLTGTFNHVSLGCENYSSTLIGWANNPNTPNNLYINFNITNPYGTNAQSARNALVNNKGWTIIGDTQSTSACVLSNLKFDNKEFNISPNPTSDILNINFNQTNKKPFEFSLYDASGRLIKTEKFSATSTSYQVDVSNVLKNNYVYKISGEDYLKTGILLKE